MNLFDQIKSLSPEDKVSKAKIALYRQSPFFAYIAEHLIFQEDVKKVLPYPTMGVNAKGHVIYTKEFVDKLSPTELVGLIAHESSHVGMQHLTRGKGKPIKVSGHSLWNIAVDIIANQLLGENGFSLPTGGYTPQNNSITVFDKLIENINEKSAEDIYEELKVELKEMVADGRATEAPDGSGGQGSGECKTDKSMQEGFDNHMDANGQEGEGKGNEQGEQSGGLPDKDGVPDKDWSKVMAEAYNHAKLIGKEPSGMARMFEHLHRHKLNWRTLLRRTVASKVPYDLTYTRPNKKYMAHDIFMPSIYGESVKVICAIDTSGSISTPELTAFVSEMVGIARSFNQAEFRILTHDCEIHDDMKVMDGNINKIKSLVPHGGGGTDHRPVYDYIRAKKLKRTTKLFISFTDGYSCYPEQRPDVDTIFVLAGAHCPPEQMPKWGTTVCLD